MGSKLVKKHSAVVPGGRSHPETGPSGEEEGGRRDRCLVQWVKGKAGAKNWQRGWGGKDGNRTIDRQGAGGKEGW